MPTPDYQPPRQSGAGQLFDSLFLVVLVFLSLLAPVLLASGGTGAEAQKVEAGAPPPPSTWESLRQTPAQAQQWEKLGHTPDSAKAMIEHRFDYSIDPLWLGITVLVIVAYFAFVLTVSDRQYREVIRERFGERDD